MPKNTRDLTINLLGGAVLLAAVAGLSIAISSASRDVAELLNVLFGHRPWL